MANNFRPKELEFSDKTLFGKAGKNKSLVAESLLAKKSLSLSPRSTNKHTRSKTSPGQGVFHLQEPGLQSLRRSRSEVIIDVVVDHNMAQIIKLLYRAGLLRISFS